MRSVTLLALFLCAALSGPVDLRAQEPPAETKTGRITGRVIDALGVGIAAARVSVLGGEDGKQLLARTVCDADGMFVCTKLPLDGRGYLRVRAEAKGRCVGDEFTRVTTSAPESFETLRLWDAGTLAVRVVDAEGRGLKGVAVIAEAHESRVFGFEPQGKGESDAEGKLTLEGIPLGAVDVRAWLPGWEPESRTIWLKDRAELELVLRQGAGVALVVRVDALPEGKEASVRVLPYASGSLVALPGLGSKLATEKGVLRLVSLPDYEYRVSVHLDDHVASPGEFRLEPGKGPHEAAFAMQRRDALRLRAVLRDAAGKALAGERVRCRASNMASGAEGLTDDEGRVVMDAPLGKGEQAIFEVLGGRWTLEQEKTEGMYGVWDARFMGDHECVIDPALEYALTAIPAVTITGKVVDGEGKPVRGRRIELQESQSNRMPSWMMVQQTSSLADGSFTLRGVYPLARGVRLALDAQGTVCSEVFDLAGKTKLEDIVLEAVPLCTIEGQLRDGQGQPLAGARVWLRNWNAATGQQIDGSVLEILSDRNGRYRFVDVEPGGHRIEVHGIGRETLATGEAFELAAGATATSDFDTGR
ncbi:MAG: carboxypeptidase regulatory-like domain-containing protein [Planctomycetes bacterium]|nr:carboxypeptidase regulatory-like domain-containing protein [Planctomycetota bacterium]